MSQTSYHRYHATDVNTRQTSVREYRHHETSHTLIDNIFSNNIEDSLKLKLTILLNDISNHKIIFTYEKIGSMLKKMSNILSWKSKTAGDMWQYHVPMSYWQTLLTMHDNDNEKDFIKHKDSL